MSDSAFCPDFRGRRIESGPADLGHLGGYIHRSLVMHGYAVLAILQVEGLAEHVDVCLQGRPTSVWHVACRLGTINIYLCVGPLLDKNKYNNPQQIYIRCCHVQASCVLCRYSLT